MGLVVGVVLALMVIGLICDIIFRLFYLWMRVVTTVVCVILTLLLLKLVF